MKNENKQGENKTKEESKIDETLVEIKGLLFDLRAGICPIWQCGGELEFLEERTNWQEPDLKCKSCGAEWKLYKRPNGEVLNDFASAIAEIDKPETIDVLSDLIHNEWESWSQNTAKGLHDVKVSCYEGNTREAIQKINTMINRWEHNWRPYNNLLEDVKEQDRIWARKVIEALKSRLEAQK